MQIAQGDMKELKYTLPFFVLAIKDNLTQKQPFFAIPSNLCTLIILQFIGLSKTQQILRKLSHTSRTYYSRQHDMLRRNINNCMPLANNMSKRSNLAILSFYGKPDNSLQLMQMLNKKSRAICTQEDGFKETLQAPKHDVHLS